MAMRKWWQDTEKGLSTNPFCRYILLEMSVVFFLFTFVGFGYVFVWLALTQHFFVAIAPFNPWVDKLMRQIGLPFVPFESLKDRSRTYRWYFVGRRLVTGTLILLAGLYLMSKVNFSLVSLLWLMMSR